MSRVSASDPERVRLLILQEYYLLEKKKIVFAMYPESVCEEDVDTPALPGSFERGNHRLLLLEEYFLLEKKKLLEDMQAPRRWWVRPLWKNRSTESEFYTAMPLLISGDPDYFRKYYRMTPDRFEQLHALVEGPLTKGYLTREPLPSRMRLAITLRYLASGMHMQEVALAFREVRRKCLWSDGLTVPHFPSCHQPQAGKCGFCGVGVMRIAQLPHRR
ncbi:hypothetical protein V5799_006934 [Amblyomma americanum]|uniref:Uncharacterized protein n=1 Tax=Amblyomma americanum TaxID=6943 RepID=A0AAQ4DUZ5_AMBAM